MQANIGSPWEKHAEGSPQSVFDVKLLTKWEILESKHKLCVKLLRNCKLGSTSKTIHYPIVDHLVIENPEAVGNCQKMGDHTNGPGGGCVTGRNTCHVGVL